ncbi:FKBP-type peptidyl-prolyl cis-trans isomerase [Pedobacter sandarakinus]|uniref:FKBP-type peptidyl-prolyl cis-trans isomerase n=1 Tax=Pedobacter sandarakinus TaxID=353156 RepID=UPI00224764DF|nr:FKBP-type peptidyl-prolyl cis-trans isomerase [Pedobacter sandarakinus]MCX2576208.1 FKBP-type peptidyl-prolyl cis-trans isomerase [Pedobacter sandarakinus]
MKRRVVILFAAATALVACNKYEKGEGDMTYKIYNSEGKPKIQEGDFVKLNGIQVIETANGDSTLVNTYDNERPAFFPIGKAMFKGDMVAALKLLGEGDSAAFRLNLDSMAKYSGQPKPAGSKDNFSTFTVKIEKVLHKAANEPDSLFEKKKRTFFEDEYKALIAKNKASENAKISKYIADNKLKTQTTSSGLQYVIEAPGNADRATLTDTIMVDYTGQFTNKKADGKLNVFDTSDAKIAKETGIYSPMAQYAARPLVLNQLAPGFIEGVQLIGIGGKIKIIIPSKLGYGENGGGPINPFTPLIFDIEIKAIKKASGVASTAPSASALPR